MEVTEFQLYEQAPEEKPMDDWGRYRPQSSVIAISSFSILIAGRG